MAHNYTPSATYHATYPVPDDGDPAIAASVNSPLEDLADGLAYGVGPMASGGTIVLGGALAWSGTAIYHNVTSVEFGGSVTIGGGPGAYTLLVARDASFTEDVSLGSSAADAITINGTLSVTANATIGVSGSSALSVIASTTFSNNVTFNGAVSSAFTFEVTGTLECDGAATFNGNVTIGDSSSDSLDVLSTVLLRGQVTIGNDSGSEGFTVNSPTNFEDTVEFNANVEVGNSGTELNVNAPTLFRSDVTLGNSSADDVEIIGSCDIQNLAAAMGFTGSGRVPLRPVLVPNSNTTYTVSSGNIFHMVGTTLTATRDYTFDGSSAVDGDHFIFVSRDEAFDIDLQVTVDGSFVTGTTLPAAGDKIVIFVRTAGSWVMAVRLVA